VRAAALVATGAAVLAAGCGGTAPPAVVAIRVPDGLGSETATGFIAGDGRLLTVAHVLAAGRPVFAERRRARVLRVDRRLDVAVLAAGGAAGPAPERAGARPGEPVTVRTIDGAVRGTVRRTITARLKGLDGRVRVRPALELAAAVEPGDSGAPVLDGDGRVVGMVFARASDRDGLAYALDARALP
jgi:S1-C subfamily serine protease